MLTRTIARIALPILGLFLTLSGTAFGNEPRRIVSAALDTAKTSIKIVYAAGNARIERPETAGDTFGVPQLSANHEVVGWSVNRIDGSSYAQPEWLQFVQHEVRRSVTCAAGMPWAWRFAGTRQVVIECGFPHGAVRRQRELVDVATGDVIASVTLSDTGAVDPEAPLWARQILRRS